MKKRFISALLAVVLALGIVTPALAYSTADFSDVPPDHWAYESVMKMADAGVIKGTGNNLFSPELKVSVAQFLTLVGRVIFPDVTADGDDWYGPYVSKAQEAGLLTGTLVDVNNVEAEITRYDMAVILRAAAKKLGAVEKAAQQSQVTDYLDIPTRYADAVLAVYGMGLIQGDQNGNFNGQDTMSRQEVATVMDRLTTLQKKTSEGGTTGETLDVGYHLELTGDVAKEGTVVLGERIWAACYAARNAGGDYPSYGQDRSGFTHTSSNPSVVQVEHDPESWNWYLTALSLGSSTITITDPNGVSLSFDITVVSQRENVAMKTYQVHVNLRNEKHTIRGNAYKETTYLYDTPFKLYYTRDGETFQLVTEGRTPVYDPKTQFKTAKLEVELPEDSFYSEDAGFYVSAEAELDGQRIVTSDLRTDGRDFIKLTQNIDPDDPYEAFVTLAPPEGEKSHFPFKGKVIGGSGSVANATVQLYLENGMLVGETTANTDGTFEMECVVDEIDGGFDKNAKIYRLVFSRPADSKRYSTVGLSLVKLKVAPILNEEGWGPMNFEMTIFW